jgi:capsular exopolysaccharide synthesis family protein
MNLDFYPTQYRLLQSRGLAESVVQKLGMDRVAGPDSPRQPLDEGALAGMAYGLLGGLSVAPIQGTQLVEISYIASDPEFAARAANGFAEAFIEMGIESRSTSTTKATSLLGSEIENLKQEIADREEQLRAASRQADLITDPGSDVLSGRLEALTKSLNDLVSTRTALGAKLQETLNTPKETLADTAPAVQQARTQLREREREYETRLKTYKPEYPAMAALKSQIDKLRKDLERSIEDAAAQAQEDARSAYQTAQRQEALLTQQIEAAKAETLQLGSAARDYQNLQDEIETRRTKLTDLLRRQNDTAVTSRLQDTRDSNIRVIERALVPGAPFAPSLRREVSLGLLAGLMLGIGIVALIEFLDRSLKSPEQAERILGLPTLAVVPDVSAAAGGYGYGRYGYGYGYGFSRRKSGGERTKRKGGEADDEVPIELLPHARPRLAASEAYRSLRTAILLSSAEELKIISVTSAQSGEGKTATSSNLAVVMAQLGKQVLLVDADLRKPRAHEVLRVSNRLGLVNFLTGSAKAEQVFLRSEIPNLWITPSGPVPPNPSELLSSQRMREFLHLARASFDFVIVDTPPMLAVTDASVVGSMTDGVVLCLRARKVLLEDARAVRERLRLGGTRMLGTVLNRFREPHGRYGRYGRRYHGYVAYGAETAAAEAKPGTAA